MGCINKRTACEKECAWRDILSTVRDKYGEDSFQESIVLDELMMVKEDAKEELMHDARFDAVK